MGLKFTQPLKKNHQFRYIYNKGKSLSNRHLIIYVLENRTGFNFLGISVSKKVGISVVRNRVKRLIRESYRLSEDKLQNGHTVVIIARPACNGAVFSEINNSFLHLMKKHTLFVNMKEELI